MADAATSVENTTGRQCKKHTKIIGSLVFVIVLLMFLVAAIAVAFIFSRSKTINTQPKQKQSEHKEENNSTDENLRIGSFTGYPFMAALYSEKPHVLLCSCAIVTKHHLLTAANCFSVLFPRLFVRTGSPFWNEGGNVYQVENVAIHENYSATNFEKNLAIVKINTTIIFSGSINLAKIEKNVSWDEGYLTVMGWGASNTVLQYYKFVAEEKCLKENREASTQLCGLFTKSSCDNGFSGAIVLKNKLVGFWSFGPFQRKKKVSITKLSGYIDWIKSRVSQ